MDLELDHKCDTKSQCRFSFFFRFPSSWSDWVSNNFGSFLLRWSMELEIILKSKLAINSLWYENISLYFVLYIYFYISILSLNWTNNWKLVYIYEKERGEWYKRVLIFYMQPRKHILKYLNLHNIQQSSRFWIIWYLGFIFFPFLLHLTGIKSLCTFFHTHTHA